MRSSGADLEGICEEVKQASKGWGTDEEYVGSILASTRTSFV